MHTITYRFCHVASLGGTRLGQFDCFSHPEIQLPGITSLRASFRATVTRRAPPILLRTCRSDRTWWFTATLQTSWKESAMTNALLESCLIWSQRRKSKVDYRSMCRSTHQPRSIWNQLDFALTDLQSSLDPYHTLWWRDKMSPIALEAATTSSCLPYYCTWISTE